MFTAITRRGGAAVLASVLLASPAWAGEEPDQPPGPKIQVALLLDTSNSMDGLIDQARTQLWNIVSEFTTIELGGQTPQLEVALYEYGNDDLPPEEHFVRLVVPLTSDLDKISEAMFALRTNGGSEFCGRVLDNATRQLTWSNSNRDVKCIFIAGNEPFTQGDLDYRDACKAAAGKNITISTIFCGSRDEGVRTGWEEGARLADGQFLCIDQDQQVAAVTAPQDAELARLGAELNRTYLPYGEAQQRSEAVRRQAAQDANAAQAAPAVAAARMAVKASRLYRNPQWDLVDALSENRVRLEDLTDDQLPEALRGLTPAARQAHLQRLQVERQQLQTKIAELNDARKVYLADYAAKQQAQRAAAGEVAAPAAAFENAVIDAVRAAAAER